MRNSFKLYLPLGSIPISEVKIPSKSRDELPPVLLALQTIFVNQEYHKKMFSIVEPIIKQGKKQTGREGMTIWEVIVLSVIRLTLNTNYDRLLWIANSDKYVRQLMGVEPDDFGFSGSAKTYSLTALKENISLLKLETIEKINALVLEVGQGYIKKDQEVRLKADSYVVKTNVHFPTDYNLLWDAARKCIEISCALAEEQKIAGWRKASDWKKRVKIEFRKVQKTKKSGGKNKESRLKHATKEYLNLAEVLDKKTAEFIIAFKPNTSKQVLQILELEYYKSMLVKHIDLVERRLIKGEGIPHSEKVFSLFEPHTKWISKGKAGVICELGQKHLIVTDQNHFIVYHKLIEDTPDATFTIEIAEKLKEQFGDDLASLSLDKGFSSKQIITELEGIIPNAIIKQKGKPNKARQETERTEDFKSLNNSHQAIESNINQLEYHGLQKCKDKGEENFKKYVSMGVLSYNLHRLGNLIKKEHSKEKRKIEGKAA